MNETLYNILDRIEKQGFEAFIIGGYVRDLLLKKKNYDVDITTNARPKDIKEIFKDYEIEFLEYGNVSFNIGDYSFEITTYRKDINYVNKRKPEKIEYVDSLEEDIKRRDFTVNTICMNKDGKIIDTLNAKEDIRKKVIKCVGDPYKKMEEDALRILRAIRISTILKFRLDDTLIDAIKKNKSGLKELSYTRKKEELNKIFLSSNKSRGVRLIKELDLLGELELKNIDNVLKTNYPTGMWATICCGAYPFTKNEKVLIKEIDNLLLEDINDDKVLYKYGLYAINVVCDLKKINKKKVVRRYENLPIKDKKDINITTEDICKVFNKEAGPFISEIIEDLEISILNKEVDNKKEDLIAYLKEKYVVL